MFKQTAMRWSAGLGAIFSIFILVPALVGGEGKNDMKHKELSLEEAKVIIHKGTEQPFSGKYMNHHKDGAYTCKRCGAKLFASSFKFDSGCGWPSFDAAVDGAVKEVPDSDGLRTEIVCSKCAAHLGHVFKGEGFTERDVRHCVNSISLDFVSKDEENERAYFAGGCFWGVEYYLEKEPGVLDVLSGYMGGFKENPTYEQVCAGQTGHAETVEVVFDPNVTNFETLAKLFFEIHDPTQSDRQGPDVGNQYRSAVFYTNDAQKKVALSLIATLRERGYAVVTEVVSAGTFFNAEEYHQDYYSQKGGAPYCHSRTKHF